MACQWCEVLPEAIPEEGTLYISAPISVTESAIRSAIRKAGLEAREDVEGVIAVDGSADQVAELCIQGFSGLGPIEKRGTRVLVVARNTPITIRELIHMEALSALISRIEGQEIVSLLEAKRLSTWFQPIVDVQAPENVFAYECLSRGFSEDGSVIRPDRMFQVAREADLLFYLDRAARISAIDAAAEKGINENIFINFNPTSIYSPHNCLRTTFEAITRKGIPKEQIVFEIVESDEVADIEHLQKTVEHYRKIGFRVALDDLGAGFNSLTSLNELRPDFMKLDIDLIRNVDRDAYKARIADNLLDLADRLHIPSIVEGIETPGEFSWVRQHGAKFAQGYLFARPSEEPVKPKMPPL